MTFALNHWLDQIEGGLNQSQYKDIIPIGKGLVGGSYIHSSPKEVHIDLTPVLPSASDITQAEKS